jgi:hypothetical protein
MGCKKPRKICRKTFGGFDESSYLCDRNRERYAGNLKRWKGNSKRKLKSSKDLAVVDEVPTFASPFEREAGCKEGVL